MQDNQAYHKTHVETVANIILEVIRKNPNITTHGVSTEVRKNPVFPNISDSMVRQYLKAIHKSGHIQKMGVALHSYKSINDTPFKYMPVAFNKKRT